MADDKRAEAVKIIALRVTRMVSESGGAEPEDVDYPHINSHLWHDIWAEVDRITESMNPTEEQFVAAHEYLTGETP